MDYVNGCFCNLETGCHPVCKEYNMSLENSIAIGMNRVDYNNNTATSAIGASGAYIGTVEFKDSSFKQKLDMNKVKYDWCYDVLIKINEVIQSNSSDQDKLHAIAWFTKQGLK